MPANSDDGFEWRNDIEPTAWDRALAALGGHPLQSALWGDVRRELDGIADQRWMAFRADAPAWMARIEQRRLPAFGWVGWTPRGPTGDPDTDLPPSLRRRLESEGMLLLVTDRWQPETAVPDTSRSVPRTIWVDLTIGLDALSRSLDKQWRYGVGRARRMGVSVDTAAGANDVGEFFILCRAVAERKQFPLPTHPSIMERLLANSNPAVEARLFLARHQGRIGAGAFVIRCGRSLHYFWGATDRQVSEARAGEAVQWAVIEWGVAMGCARYDLEGIDPVHNPGTYAFKKKMGGAEVTLRGQRTYPLGLCGRALAWLYAMRN